jgi:aminoglycoside phosphotransferase (APT) family kinase protein
VLSRRLGGGSVTGLTRLLGGASRESWAFELDGRRLVLRRDPPGAPRAGGMAREAALLRAAAAAGVPVPDVVDADETSIVMTWLDGETIARRILRDEAYAVARSRLVEQLAAALARLHHGVPPADIDGLPAPVDPVADLRAALDAIGEPHPALELGLRWLDSARPTSTARVVVHGDFRLGNLMVGSDGLVGVLDWELAHIGDAAEDLGWLCVRSWRFGSPLPVAGVGVRTALLTAYAAAGGAHVDAETLDWWEAYGTLRWAVICAQQAATHLSGAVRSVELAVIGRRVCEVELDLLDLLVGPRPIDRDPRRITVGAA